MKEKYRKQWEVKEVNEARDGTVHAFPLWLPRFRASGFLSFENVVQRDPDEYCHAKIVVVEESGKTAFARAVTNEKLLVQRQARGNAQTQAIPSAELHFATHQPEREQRHELHDADEKTVGIAEGNGARVNADS